MHASAQGRWTVPTDLPFFNGHFPGRPILPAVATVDYIVTWLEKQLGGSQLKLQEVKSAKFAAPITPGLTIQITAGEIEPHDWRIEIPDPASGGELAALRLILTRS